MSNGVKQGFGNVLIENLIYHGDGMKRINYACRNITIF